MGTENYMAPEIFSDNFEISVNKDKGKGSLSSISKEVDYWALGVLIFELHTNKLPFMANSSEIFENIKNLKIKWDSFDKLAETNNYPLLHHAKDLILKFLKIKPSERWGSNNINDIKNHPFFTNFDWKNIKHIKDHLVLQHVDQQIKQIKQPQQKKAEINNTSIKDDTGEIINIEGDLTMEFNLTNYFCTERVDNLFKKCQDILKNNIRQKKLEIDPGDYKFTDFMNDLNN